MNRAQNVARKLDAILPRWFFGVHGVIWWFGWGVLPMLALGVVLTIDGRWYAFVPFLFAIPPALAMVRDGLNRKL